MKYTAAIVLASAITIYADCNIESFEIGGNYFCQAVSHIAYDNLNMAGSYQAVSYMDSSGACDFDAKDYSGSIAPFDEELSVHIRGPTHLKTFAVYTPNTSKKRDKPEPRPKRHGHQHLHRRQQEAKQEEKRADMVSATINGKVVEWVNNYFGEPSTEAPASPAPAPEPSMVKPAHPGSGSGSNSGSSSSSDDGASTAKGDFKRIAYYEAESQTADNVAFLGNLGGQGSGVFDTKFGNSLSYINEDASAGSASPTVLKNGLVGDALEYSIWTDKECAEGDADCGYWRPGSVAYHGFGGADKVFLLEFKMPMSGKTGFANADMPAVWLLNSKIPRTMQYGSCSCWGGIGKSGCGEFDVFEVLASGDTKCKSTFHFANSIGSSDYFERPLDYVKVAVVFKSSTSTASIKVLPASTDFSTGLTSAQVDEMIDTNNDLGLSTLVSIPV